MHDELLLDVVLYVMVFSFGGVIDTKQDEQLPRPRSVIQYHSVSLGLRWHTETDVKGEKYFHVFLRRPFVKQ